MVECLTRRKRTEGSEKRSKQNRLFNHRKDEGEAEAREIRK